MINVDDLHTGANGDPTFGNEETPVEQTEAINEQHAELQRLLPSVEYIQQICDEEIKAVSDIRAYIKTLGHDPSAKKISKEYRARELYIQFIEHLKSGIQDRVTEAEQKANNV